VLIYLFRDEGTDNLALTVDVHRPEYSTHHAFDGLAFRRGDRHTEISPTVGSNRFPMLELAIARAVRSCHLPFGLHLPDDTKLSRSFNKACSDGSEIRAIVLLKKMLRRDDG